MDLLLTTFDQIIFNKNDRYSLPSVEITYADEDQILEAFQKDGNQNRIISLIDLKDVIAYHGVEEILETIGEQRVKEHVTEYWTQSDEEQ